MITSLLVANRGEIARRIFRTCRDAGITTVAVHSDVDTHWLQADYAVPLSGATPSETYLRGDLIIEAALAAGADAIHPGYGFLSENADFARAVQEAGLIWVGPPPSAMEAMASKVESRKLVANLGIPILEGGDQFPQIIKASAGGGGRGMRIVRTPSELAAQLELAAAEAESAFGDPTVFTEPYLERGHHVEVQILADTHGTVWALGERECSIQRRHQKVIEETPSPHVSPELRSRLIEAATSIAKAVSYVGAGTVEFLVQGDDFYFLEMNTRLQVEHPVTEAVYGVDLVALQLDVANGLALGDPPTPSGHAIEARLYAEDATFTPQTGTLHRFEVTGPVRVDAGYDSGDKVSVHYDAMLAKVIAFAPSRSAAVSKLAGALQRASLHGVPTNRDLLVRTLRHSTFLAGEPDTGFLESHLEELSSPLTDARLAMLAAALSVPVGWRNVRSQPTTRHFHEGSVSFVLDRGGLSGVDGVELVSASPGEVVLAVSGVRQRFEVFAYGDLVCVNTASLTKLPRFTDPAVALAAGALTAPMPGTVVEVLVADGDRVEAGQPLVRLEAMKMQHTVNAATAGTVDALSVQTGQQVDAGAVLIVILEES